MPGRDPEIGTLAALMGARYSWVFPRPGMEAIPGAVQSLKENTGPPS